MKRFFSIFCILLVVIPIGLADEGFITGSDLQFNDPLPCAMTPAELATPYRQYTLDLNMTVENYVMYSTNDWRSNTQLNASSSTRQVGLGQKGVNLVSLSEKSNSVKAANGMSSNLLTGHTGEGSMYIDSEVASSQITVNDSAQRSTVNQPEAEVADFGVGNWVSDGLVNTEMSAKNNPGVKMTPLDVSLSSSTTGLDGGAAVSNAQYLRADVLSVQAAGSKANVEVMEDRFHITTGGNSYTEFLKASYTSTKPNDGYPVSNYTAMKELGINPVYNLTDYGNYTVEDNQTKYNLTEELD